MTCGAICQRKNQMRIGHATRGRSSRSRRRPWAIGLPLLNLSELVLDHVLEELSLATMVCVCRDRSSSPTRSAARIEHHRWRAQRRSSKAHDPTASSKALELAVARTRSREDVVELAVFGSGSASPRGLIGADTDQDVEEERLRERGRGERSTPAQIWEAPWNGGWKRGFKSPLKIGG
jgi:hypothetical protein